MTVQDAETDPDSQLLDRALPAIAQLETSLANEREASRSAIHSANLLDTLTNLGHAIAEETEQLDALDLIAPGMWAAEEFHSRIISWLLDPSAHHRQAGHFIAALLNSTMAPPRLLDADWSAAQVCQEWGERRRRTVGLPGYPDPGSAPPKPHCHREQGFLSGAQQPADPLPPRSGRCLSRLRQTSHLPVPRRRPGQPGTRSKALAIGPATPSSTTPSRKSSRPA